MPNFNKVILAGNLTRDPKLSYVSNGAAVTDFGIAVNRRWKGANGEYKEETCFVDCRLFGKAAEMFHQHMTVSRAVLVEGRLQYQRWTAENSREHSKHVIVVDRFQYLDCKPGSAGAA